MAEHKECEYCIEPWVRIALMIGGDRMSEIESKDLRNFALHLCDSCFREITPKFLIMELQPEELCIAEVLEEIRIVPPQTSREIEAEELWFHQMYGAIRKVIEM